ncbi:MAG: spore maturation protein [Spirochaetes bacterium RIFOXYC1_FULL_54_7]|nr:MAG: spore maturation protein [Spirochaetes bacterium RIFOXYC1_FULL_54_7]
MFVKILEVISLYAIPVIIIFVVGVGMLKKVKVYEVFTEGAKEGFGTAIRIIPFLVAMLMAIGIFRASGAMGMLAKLLSPITNLIGMPAEIFPMALIRPLSGSGGQAMMTTLMKEFGPDSLIGRMACVMNGATDTTFYILAVYFGSIGVKKIRHSLSASLMADLAGILAAVVISNIMFG